MPSISAAGDREDWETLSDECPICRLHARLINPGLSLGRVRVDRGNARERLSRPDLSGTQAKV